ncbi:MAG: hypothetical protein HN855_04650 [Anaerolineae bacterium]|jgi:YbbR domain-containing protein|nr:hypothetical protein [Anaerolineae bacterium]MBT7070385.1 hypothetical protein [Anaerolineae bacterium]MBT7324427.1 hypothetical protein [Anaerolineae bacterium]
MFRWLGKNIGTFFLALFLAIGVWVAAVNDSDPDEVLTYPAPIQIEIVGQGTDLLITNTYSKQIELTLRAPRSIWGQLTADDDSVHAILDLSGLSAGEYLLEPQIQISTQPVRIISVSPIEVEIHLEELATRTLPVQLNLTGAPSVGYQAGDLENSVQEATISGPKSLVESVAIVQASFDLSDTRENIDERLTLEILDVENQTVTGINLTPTTTQLIIPISQQGGYRDVAVKVTISGQVANLYRLTNISVFPPVVTTYSADAQLISELPGVVETEILDISGISEDISAHLNLILPENITLIGDQTVLVQASVEAILGSLTISEKHLEVINLDPALTATLSSFTVDVIVSGPLNILETLSPTDLRVIVDVDGLGTGTHQLTPKVEILNSAIQVESILPESVEVILSEVVLATPTAQP